jgi:hypothetical protein
MTRLRIGHVGVANHMQRFNMKDSNMCGSCGVVDDVPHLMMKCNKYDNLRLVARAKLEALNVGYTLQNILGCGDFSIKTQKQIQEILAAYVTGTGRVDEL